MIPSARHLGIDWDKLNVNRLSLVLGHTFGMTGARIMTTLLNVAGGREQTIGLELSCEPPGSPQVRVPVADERA